MRRIRYCVATSLDGFIAGPNGEADWIEPDPEVDFAALWSEFDTGIMGRRTYEVAVKRLGEKAFGGIKIIVFSRTMKPQDHPQTTIIPELDAAWIRSLKKQSGKDIWLFGGAQLFRAFLAAGCIDTIELNIIPVMLGDGIPLIPPPYGPIKLKLASSKVYRSGRIAVAYDLQR